MSLSSRMRQTVLLPAPARRAKPAASARSLTNLASAEIDHNSAAKPWSLGLVHAMLTTQALASSLISGSCGRWRDLRDWQLTRCLFVGDAGMVSAANFKALAAGGGKYLMCMPLRRGDALTEQVLSRAGRYRKVNERLQIKEVVLGDGERRLRYVVCFNPEEATRQQAHRRHLLDHLQAELAAMGDAAQDVQSKRVAALRSSSRWGKYLTLGDKGLQLDANAIKAAERYGGKFLVHGNDDTLSAEDMALGYKQMIRVESRPGAT